MSATASTTQTYANYDFAAMNERNQKLLNLSQLVVNGQLTYKLDLIATVNINGQKYFNVFRRYNSPYDYVIEDANGDHYCHKDYTVRESLRAVLCLSQDASHRIYTKTANSYKHNAPVPSMPIDIADMRWSQIQQLYYAVDVDFGGILEEYQQVCEECKRFFQQEETHHTDQPEEVPSTPQNQVVDPEAEDGYNSALRTRRASAEDETEAPPAPKRRRLNDGRFTIHMVSFPVQTLSERFRDICEEKADQSTPSDEQMEDDSTDSYELESESESESESNDQSEQPSEESTDESSHSMELSEDEPEEISFDYSDDDEVPPIDENDYIMLRNGTAVPKFKY